MKFILTKELSTMELQAYTKLENKANMRKFTPYWKLFKKLVESGEKCKQLGIEKIEALRDKPVSGVSGYFIW